MQKMLISLFFMFMLSINLSYGEVSAKHDSISINYIYPTYSFDESYPYDRIDINEYVFIGEIISKTGVSHYDGTLSDIPFTNYKVKVIQVLKGEISKNIIDITYYGGYTKDGELKIVHSDYSKKGYLPVKNEVYIFTVNKNKIAGEEKRVKNASYIVYDPFQADLLIEYNIKEDIFEQSITTSNQISVYANYITPPTPLSIGGCPINEICGDPGGGTGGGTGGEPGESLDEAIQLIIGDTYSGSISGTDKIYFKATYGTPKDLILSSSTRDGIDLEIKMYDDSKVLKYPDDCPSNDNECIPPKYSELDDVFQDIDTIGNFKAYALVGVPDNISVYYEVYLKDVSKSGDFSVSLTQNLDACRNIRDGLEVLTSEHYNSPYQHAVGTFNSHKVIVYTDITDGDYSSIIEYSAGVWNSINQFHYQYVTIMNEYDESTADVNLTFVTNTDPNDEKIAYYDYFTATHEKKIVFNKRQFDSLSLNEKRRTIIHELGHALGMFEFNLYEGEGPTLPESRYNIMRQGVRDYPLTPGDCDIEVYKYLWE